MNANLKDFFEEDGITETDIKRAVNSLYGQKATADRCFEAAISEKLDLSKPEDVVRALFHAYLYMYNRADNDDAERVLSKYYELVAAYDMSTGKPKTESGNKRNETWAEFRLNQLEIAVANLINNVNELKATDHRLPLKLMSERIERLEAKEDNK